MPNSPQLCSASCETRLVARADRRGGGGARADRPCRRRSGARRAHLQDGEGRRPGQPLGRRSSPSPTRSTPPAPKSSAAEKQPPCQQVGGVDYGYGIGQLEVTVAQYVAFLNTADPAGRNRHKLYSSNESPSAWPKFGQIDFSAERRAGPPLLGRRAGMGRQALRLRQLPALGPLRQLALQRQAALQAGQRRRQLQLRHLPGPPLAPDRAGDVRHDASGR